MGGNTVRPGQRSADHHHGEADSGIYVVSGRPRFVFLVDGRERVLDAAPGDFIYVPAWVPHREENRSGAVRPRTESFKRRMSSLKRLGRQRAEKSMAQAVRRPMTAPQSHTAPDVPLWRRPLVPHPAPGATTDTRRPGMQRFAAISGALTG